MYIWRIETIVKTLDYAKRKWARKTPAAAEKWKKMATAGTAEYCPAFGKFIGAAIKPEICSAQREGIAAVSAEDWRATVPPEKAEKYARNLVAAVT